MGREVLRAGLLEIHVDIDLPKRIKTDLILKVERNDSWIAVKNTLMNTKPISPKTHALIDYALVGCLLTLPSLLGLSKKVKTAYAVEAFFLLPYIALTKQPIAVKGLIPFETHGKIDPFNVAQFAIQSFTRPFRKSKKALTFNLIFTAVAGLTVLLTDWSGE